jgi:hypothetical protein
MLDAMFGMQPQFIAGRGGGTGACKQEGYKLSLLSYERSPKGE